MSYKASPNTTNATLFLSSPRKSHSQASEIYLVNSHPLPHGAIQEAITRHTTLHLVLKTTPRARRPTPRLKYFYRRHHARRKTFQSKASESSSANKEDTGKYITCIYSSNKSESRSSCIINYESKTFLCNDDITLINSGLINKERPFPRPLLSSAPEKVSISKQILLPSEIQMTEKKELVLFLRGSHEDQSKKGRQKLNFKKSNRVVCPTIFEIWSFETLSNNSKSVN